ncbi:hypothetical protein [Hungatella hathewayi]|uniref:hypothetical protein n=1 Tax=Hungatella hathewayi TaxID=154046 RepID=UPI0015F56648|nr:hypothetical protein [Hungatella hathewayi]
MDKRRIVEIFYEITNMEEEEFEKLRTTIFAIKDGEKEQKILTNFFEHIDKKRKRGH